MNLLEETINILDRYGRGPDDVLFVSDDENSTSWENFAKIADRYNYDEGFGSREVNQKLMVVGNNWWLERHAYDGSEWWEFKTLPMPKSPSEDGTLWLGNIYDRSDYYHS